MEAPQVSLNDLKILIEIIDVSVNKAAFASDQIAVVGCMYQKLQMLAKYCEDSQKESTLQPSFPTSSFTKDEFTPENPTPLHASSTLPPLPTSSTLPPLLKK